MLHQDVSRLWEWLYVVNTFLIHPCCIGSSCMWELNQPLQCDQVLCKEFSIHDRSRHWFSPLFVYDKLVIWTAPAISGGKGIMLSYTGTILLSFVLALTGLSITAKGNVCIYPRLWPDVTVKMNSSHNAGISLISISKFHILFTHTEAVRDLRCESTL